MTHIFIVNTFAGQKTFANNLREKLKEYDNLTYFVFNTRQAGEETDLVQRILKIFDGDQLRFYCCGGSGTMRNVLCGLVAAGKLSDVEVAFFPCGLTNDFIKMFGEQAVLFSHIEELIQGDVIPVDYIWSDHGMCINTFSVGMDSNIIQKIEEYRGLSILGQQVPYVLAVLYSVMISKPVGYEIYYDNHSFEGPFVEVFFGNGAVLGGNLIFSTTAKVNDGKACYCVANCGRLKSIAMLSALMRGQAEKYNQVAATGECTRIQLRRKDGKPFQINMDGELSEEATSFMAQIVKHGVKLVVPKGVRL